MGDKEKRDEYYEDYYELYGKSVLDDKRMNGILETKQRSAEIDNKYKSRNDDVKL